MTETQAPDHQRHTFITRHTRHDSARRLMILDVACTACGNIAHVELAREHINARSCEHILDALGAQAQDAHTATCAGRNT